MTGRRAILNDGTIIENGEVGDADERLWVWFTGYTLPEAASMFFDSAKTEKIVFEYGEMSDIYEGFTDCMVLQISTDGTISVCLKRGV